MDLQMEIREAAGRTRPYVRVTPLDPSPVLSEKTGNQIYLKLENLQHTGSFKLRGALNKLLWLAPDALARGVVTASSGNHGAAVAYGLQLLHAPGIVVVPEHASPVKIEAIRRLGAEVRFHGADSAISEQYARRYAQAQGMVYIPPYNDPQVVAGQGTVGVEVVQQLPEVDTIYVAVGGGGLIGGVASYLKQHNPAARIVGCLPENSPVMYESIRAGHIVEMPSLPTLSDGTAGGIEPGAITFELCRRLVDSWILVDEQEIVAAMRLIMETHHLLVEGSAGVAVAAALKDANQGQQRQCVIVLCGANISLDTLKTIL